MAITAFRQAIDGRRILGVSQGETIVEEIWNAELDTAEDNPRLILEDPEVPFKRQPHPKWPDLRLDRIDAEGHDDSRKFWRFKLIWSTNVPNELDPNAQTFTPDQYDGPQAQRVSWGFATEKVPLERSRMMQIWTTNSDGNAVIKNVDLEYDDNEGALHAVQNSAGHAYVPPPMVDRHYTVATIEKNLLAVPIEVLYYADSINSDYFEIDGLGVDRLKARMLSISVSQRKQWRNIIYRTVTWKIELKPYRESFHFNPHEDPPSPSEPPLEYYVRASGWDMPILDQGLYYRDVRTFKRFYDAEGNPSKEPNYGWKGRKTGP